MQGDITERPGVSSPNSSAYRPPQWPGKGEGMKSFNIGDKVIVIANPKEWISGQIDFMGEITVITSTLEPAVNRVSGRLALVHVTELFIEDSKGKLYIAFEPYCLKLYYDGNDAASWKDENNVWEPKILERVDANS